MLLNNIEKDLKVKITEETSQIKIAEHIGVSDAYVNRIVRKFYTTGAITKYTDVMYEGSI